MTKFRLTVITKRPGRSAFVYSEYCNGSISQMKVALFELAVRQSKLYNEPVKDAWADDGRKWLYIYHTYDDIVRVPRECLCK